MNVIQLLGSQSHTITSMRKGTCFFFLEFHTKNELNGDAPANKHECVSAFLILLFFGPSLQNYIERVLKHDEIFLCVGKNRV